MRAKRTTCCGMVELYDLQGNWGQTYEYIRTPTPFDRYAGRYEFVGERDLLKGAHRALKSIRRMTYGLGFKWPALVVFTDVVDDPGYVGGKNLVDAIEHYKLGSVTKSGTSHNRNSGNTVQAYVWAPDYEACTAFFYPPKATKAQQEKLI